MREALEKYFGQARKIRNVSLDTNIIIDVLFHMYFRDTLSKSSWGRSYLERCKESSDLLFTFLCTRVNLFGIRAVRRELSKKSALLKIYRAIFKKEVGKTPEIRSLSKLYEKRANIKPVDAVILATVSVGKIDLFCTWNREDMVKEKSLEIIEKINKSKHLNVPLIITPTMFLERFGVTQRKTVLFTVSKVPPVFRPRFSYPM